MREIQRALPSEDLLYIADSAYAPYGDKPENVITQRVQNIGAHLLQQNVKLIVVACNTATSASVESLRSRVTVPVVAMEPAIKPAVGATKNRRIGVIATQHTASSARLRSLIDRFAGDCNVYTQGCPGLVETIETGLLEGPQIEQVLRRFIEPLLEQGIDTLVLGCTHYPLVRSVIEQIAGESVAVIDPAAAVARQVAEQLRMHQCLSDSHSGEMTCFSTLDGDTVFDRFRKIWPSAEPRLLTL